MLTQLGIRHFTLVDALDIDFQPGLTVITGETGAGKSLLVDALGLLLGGRAETRWVRHGAERATVSARFSLSNNPAARAWLAERALNDEGDDCLIRRVLLAEGGSKAWVNGQPATVQDLRELGDHLVDLHAQHEHQALLRRDSQRSLVDRFGGHADLAAQVAQLARQWRDIDQQLHALRTQSGERAAREDLLRFQLKELDSLAPQADEARQLAEQHKTLAGAEALLEAAAFARSACEGDDAPGALSLLRQARQALEKLPHRPAALDEALNLLDSAAIHADEALSSLDDFCNGFEADPQTLARIEQRLDRFYELARKHRVDADALPELHRQLQAELHTLAAGENSLDALAAECETLLARHRETSAQLSKARRKTAKTLNQAINDLLPAVGLPTARFEVILTPLQQGAPDSRGGEDIDLQVQTNPGLPMDRLAKIASGGELSRISLAIAVVTARAQTTPCLIFDEVDVGIGGQTASEVGHLLRALGRHTQVLCVTHQPQVAACGHQHLRVSKTSAADTTLSQLEVLDNKNREAEIARMLGGKTITEKTRAHAQELLAQAAAD